MRHGARACTRPLKMPCISLQLCCSTDTHKTSTCSINDCANTGSRNYVHCFLRFLRRRRTTMHSVEMHHQVQFKAQEQLRKWDERFKKLEQRHTRGLKRSRRRLYNYDAFELAGGPSSSARTPSEEAPSSPSGSQSSGSQVGAGAQNKSIELHEI